MDCRNVAEVLDACTEPRLSDAERGALEAHLARCASCGCAWQAHVALHDLSIPPPATNLLELVIAGLPRPPVARRRSLVLVGLTLLAAGAALAAIVAVSLSQSTKNPPVVAGGRAAPDAGAVDNAAATSTAPTGAAAPDVASRTRTALPPDAVYFPAVRKAPDYPQQALKQHLDGSVTLKFTVAENGAVQDVVVKESSDPIFEPAAVRAVSEWRYLPKVVAGKRVAVRDVYTVIRFQSEFASNTPAPASSAGVLSDGIDFQDFESSIEQAWEHLSKNDLRGAELVLDELRATYQLRADQTVRVSTFYGYIYTQYGDFGRAVAAYEAGLTALEGMTARVAGDNDYIALAQLYFGTGQYDMALRTLLRYKKEAKGRPIDPAATGLLTTLRRLGVTEETL
jgi:TonB family protein